MYRGCKERYEKKLANVFFYNFITKLKRNLAKVCLQIHNKIEKNDI